MCDIEGNVGIDGFFNGFFKMRLIEFTHALMSLSFLLFPTKGMCSSVAAHCADTTRSLIG